MSRAHAGHVVGARNTTMTGVLQHDLLHSDLYSFLYLNGGSSGKMNNVKTWKDWAEGPYVQRSTWLLHLEFHRQLKSNLSKSKSLIFHTLPTLSLLLLLWVFQALGRSPGVIPDTPSLPLAPLVIHMMSPKYISNPSTSSHVNRCLSGPGQRHVVLPGPNSSPKPFWLYIWSVTFEHVHNIFIK